MPAAAWAAKSGDPVLFANATQIPPETLAAIKSHTVKKRKPNVYVLAPKAQLPDKLLEPLSKLAKVKRIAGDDPVANAIAFARYASGNFGWGVVDPGHGLVFASTTRPLDAAAGAPLSASGQYGPLLLTDDAARLPRQLGQYLLDIQPGYDRDPVARGLQPRLDHR